MEIGKRPGDRYQKDKNKWKFEQVIVETTLDSRCPGYCWYYRTIKINMGRGNRVGLAFNCQGKVAKSYHAEINSPEGNPARSYKAVPLDQAATGRCILAQGKPLFFPCALQLWKTKKKAPKTSGLSWMYFTRVWLTCSCFARKTAEELNVIIKREEKKKITKILRNN